MLGNISEIIIVSFSSDFPCKWAQKNIPVPHSARSFPQNRFRHAANRKNQTVVGRTTVTTAAVHKNRSHPLSSFHIASSTIPHLPLRCKRNLSSSPSAGNLAALQPRRITLLCRAGASRCRQRRRRAGILPSRPPAVGPQTMRPNRAGAYRVIKSFG